MSTATPRGSIPETRALRLSEPKGDAVLSDPAGAHVKIRSVYFVYRPKKCANVGEQSGVLLGSCRKRGRSQLAVPTVEFPRSEFQWPHAAPLLQCGQCWVGLFHYALRMLLRNNIARSLGVTVLASGPHAWRSFDGVSACPMESHLPATYRRVQSA